MEGDRELLLVCCVVFVVCCIALCVVVYVNDRALIGGWTGGPPLPDVFASTVPLLWLA